MIMSMKSTSDFDRVQIFGVEVAEPPSIFIMLRSLGFRVWAFGLLGSGFRVYSLGLRVQASGFRV